MPGHAASRCIDLRGITWSGEWLRPLPLCCNTSALRRLPIMLLTSLTTFQDKVAGFDAGADDYVIKPFDTRHLMARIRLLSRIKRLEQRDDE